MSERLQLKKLIKEASISAERETKDNRVLDEVRLACKFLTLFPPIELVKFHWCLLYLVVSSALER